MSSAHTPVPFETLLAHRRWVRQLALTLVHDHATADDLEQRTWLSALRTRPSHERAARAWLFRVVRREAFNLARGNKRRVVHERSSARQEATRSAAEVVEEAEIHRRLVVSVLALDEPYRSTVLLRYFEDLPPRDVATRLNVPVETVRSRLRRAAAILRRRLDREGGRASWLGALLPLAGMAPERAMGTSAATAAGTGTVGAAAMGTKMTTVALVALTFLVGLAGGRLSASESESPSAGDLATLSARLEGLESQGPTEAAADETTRRANSRRRGAESESAVDIGSGLDSEIDQLQVELAAIRALADSTAVKESARFEGLSTVALIAEIDRLLRLARDTKQVADADNVLQACDVVLDREVTTEQQAVALTYRGRAHALLGDRPAAEAALNEAIAVVGTDTNDGRKAAHALGYIAREHGDGLAAARWFLGIAEQASAPDDTRAYYRYMAASDFASVNDIERALAEYRIVIGEFGESEDAGTRKWADFARDAAKKLEAAREK